MTTAARALHLGRRRLAVILTSAAINLMPFTANAGGQMMSEPLRLAPDLYLQPGDNHEISRANLGNVANRGFIVGSRSVVVIDSGVSATAGEALAKAIGHVTSKPVELVVLTHATQEFIFGAAAFQRRGIPILAQRTTAALMLQRCERCLDNLRQLLGDDTMKDSSVVKPDRLVDDSTRIDPGDRPIDLLHYGWASTPGDLAVLDRRSGTLFAGGLITSKRIPNLRDANLDGWMLALQQLRRLPIRRIVPGFGPVGGKEEIDRMQSYFRELRAAVTQHYRDGDSLIETMRKIDLPGFKGWEGYDSTHPQNVIYVYRTLENADFQQ